MINLEYGRGKEISKVEQYKNAIVLVAREIYEINGMNLDTIYPYFMDVIIENAISCEYSIDLQGNLQQQFAKLGTSFFSSEEQKDSGVFFTNNISFVKTIYKDIDINTIDICKQKILEPSVGVGALVIPIIKKIVIDNSEDSIKDIKKLLGKISENIVCIDVSPVCIYMTEVLILLELIPLLKKINDFEIGYSLPKLKMIIGDYLKVSSNLNMKFDYILGNPPYVTMYGKRSRGMSEAKRSYFNEKFDFVLNKKGNNKFNLCMFFIELGIKNLSYGGKMSFILDIVFFETAFIDIRKYILENTKVRYINIKNKNFESVASGQFVLTLQKEKSFVECQGNTISWIDDQRNVYQRQYELYNEKNHYKFSKPLDKCDQEFIEAFNRFDTLKTLCPNKQLRTCCALTGKTEEFIVSKISDTDHCKVIPFLEGSKGVNNKFAIPKSDKLIKLDYDLQIELSNQFKVELEKQGIKNKKRVTLGNIEAYFYPKIFIRQSAKELIATYTEEDFAANNSIYILTFMSYDENKCKLLKYICGLLNSNLLSDYALKTGIIRTGKGKTPQIKVSDLMKLPLPIDESKFDTIVRLVDSRLNSDCNIKQRELDVSLNSIVESIYLD